MCKIDFYYIFSDTFWLCRKNNSEHPAQGFRQTLRHAPPPPGAPLPVAIRKWLQSLIRESIWIVLNSSIIIVSSICKLRTCSHLSRKWLPALRLSPRARKINGICLPNILPAFRGRFRNKLPRLTKRRIPSLIRNPWACLLHSAGIIPMKALTSMLTRCLFWFTPWTDSP